MSLTLPCRPAREAAVVKLLPELPSTSYGWCMGSGLLKAVDTVSVRVPDLDAGLAFYVGTLDHRLIWRNDAIG